jgi:hypothetical protein
VPLAPRAYYQSHNTDLSHVSHRTPLPLTPPSRFPIRACAVGGLTLSAASALSAHGDRLEYHVTHATHGRTHMVMWFRDFTWGRVNTRARRLDFHVRNP